MVQVTRLAHARSLRPPFPPSHFRSTDGNPQISISFGDLSPIVLGKLHVPESDIVNQASSENLFRLADTVFKDVLHCLPDFLKSKGLT